MNVCLFLFNCMNICQTEYTHIHSIEVRLYEYKIKHIPLSSYLTSIELGDV